MSVEFAPVFWIQKKEHVLTPEDERQMKSIKEHLALTNQEIARVDGEMKQKRIDANLFRLEAKLSPAVERRRLQGRADVLDEFADLLEQQLKELQKQRAGHHVAMEAIRQSGIQ